MGTVEGVCSIAPKLQWEGEDSFTSGLYRPCEIWQYRVIPGLRFVSSSYIGVWWGWTSIICTVMTLPANTGGKVTGERPHSSRRVYFGKLPTGWKTATGWGAKRAFSYCFCRWPLHSRRHPWGNQTPGQLNCLFEPHQLKWLLLFACHKSQIKQDERKFLSTFFSEECSRASQGFL